MWQVDWEILQIRTGCTKSEKDVLEAFKNHVVAVDKGSKWFISSFIEFQYGPELSKANNIYKSICKILDRYDLWEYVTVQIVNESSTGHAIRARISKKTRDTIFMESDMTCQYCQERKSVKELAIDHFLPIQLGGTNEDENLVCACHRCNGHKTDLHPCDFLSRSHTFLNPTEKIKALYKKYEGAFNDLQGPKDKDKDKVKDKEQEQEREIDKEKEKEQEAPIDFFEPDTPGDSIIFPFDTEPMRTLWAGWKRVRWLNHQVRYKMHGEQADLRRLQGMTYPQIESTIQQAIAGNWKNLYPEKNGTGQGNSKRDSERNARREDFARRHGTGASG